MAEGGWFSRLKSGLSRSSGRLTESIGAILTKRKLDETALEELEEAMEVTRKDTTDLMISGGKVSKEKIM